MKYCPTCYKLIDNRWDTDKPHLMYNPMCMQFHAVHGEEV